MATRTRKAKGASSLARRRANPGLRSKLPASQLTPAQRQERARLARVKADDANPLYDPSQQLSGHNLAVSAKRLVDAQLTPKIGAIDTQIGSTRTQGNALAGRAGDYYRQLGSEEAGLAAKQQALAAMTNKVVTDNNAQANQALTDASSAEQKRQADDAALRGGGLGGDTSTVPKVIAAAQQQRAILGPAAANAAAAQGEGWAGLANAMTQATQMRGGEVQGELGNAQMNAISKLAQSKADLEATRGDLTTEQVDKLRQQSFENAVTMKGLGIKQADIATTARGQSLAAQTAARNRRSTAASRAASTAATVRGQDLSHTDRVAARREAAKKRQDAADARTRAAAQKAWGSVENLVPKLGQAKYTDPTTGATRPATTQETIAALRNSNQPEWAIQAAVSIRHHGYVTQQVIDLIRRVAPQVRIPSKYRPPSGGTSGAAVYTKGAGRPD